MGIVKQPYQAGNSNGVNSGGPNMGLVIFMQVLSQNCTVLDSVNHIGIGALAIGVSARVLPHVPANKSHRRDGSPWHGRLDGVNETSGRIRFRRIHHLGRLTLRRMACRGVKVCRGAESKFGHGMELRD
ncbi:hypothetical protein HaLaN_11622 [Haematococcus lacustris]|uniref:Uncharacterized protein n=1 Tax=Haematococcus lacustris TaxID=44745 RepID=A0A699Z834_HAELA|nr:hypothetical protein HaLaN_11622 [Haematococcus lacustris]